MSDVKEAYLMASNYIDATERADDATEGDKINAHLKGIFEMLAEIASQLEEFNTRQTAT